MAAPVPPIRSVDEYFAVEAASDARHEFVDGHVYMMAGGSRWHDAVIFNLSGLVYRQLREGSCRGHSSNQRVKVGTDYVYPDLSISCDPQYENRGGDTLLNPVAVFEVLSPSTERFDRQRKFDLYESISTLEDYIIISQDQVRIEHYSRQSNGTWLLVKQLNLEDRLRLKSVDLEFLLREIYENVAFEDGVAPDRQLPPVVD